MFGQARVHKLAMRLREGEGGKKERGEEGVQLGQVDARRRDRARAREGLRYGGAGRGNTRMHTHAHTCTLTRKHTRRVGQGSQTREQGSI